MPENVIYWQKRVVAASALIPAVWLTFSITYARAHAQKLLAGKGFCSDVYAWGEGRVLKLFHGLHSAGQARREYAATRAVHAAGLPAPAPLEVALCHGDFHPGNVLITPAGPVVIDWSSASRGDPFGDVAWTSRLMRTARLPPWSPGYMHFILRCLRSVMHRSYLKRYLQRHAGTTPT